jgi:steroid delta-isomerase-like uncharacterized protein
MSPKAVIQTFVDAVNRQDWPALETLVAADFVRYSRAAGEPAVRSRQDLLQFLQAEFVTFPDAQEEILDLLGEGDKVAVRIRFRGTQAGPLAAYPATGQRVESEYLAIFRIEGRLLVEAWAEWDNLTTLRQLGHLR